MIACRGDLAATPAVLGVLACSGSRTHTECTLPAARGAESRAPLPATRPVTRLTSSRPAAWLRLALRVLLIGGYAGLVSFHSLHPKPLRIPLRWSAFFVLVNLVAACRSRAMG